MENQKEYWWIMIQYQAKGKVERCIRTFNEEFLRLRSILPICISQIMLPMSLDIAQR